MLIHQYQPGLYSVIDPEEGLVAHGINATQAAEFGPLEEPSPALWRSAFADALSISTVKAAIAMNLHSDSLDHIREVVDDEASERGELIKQLQESTQRAFESERRLLQKELEDERKRLITLLAETHGGNPSQYVAAVNNHLENHPITRRLEELQ